MYPKSDDLLLAGSLPLSLSSSLRPTDGQSQAAVGRSVGRSRHFAMRKGKRQKWSWKSATQVWRCPPSSAGLRESSACLALSKTVTFFCTRRWSHCGVASSKRLSARARSLHQTCAPFFSTRKEAKRYGDCAAAAAAAAAVATWQFAAALHLLPRRQ